MNCTGYSLSLLTAFVLGAATQAAEMRGVIVEVDAANRQFTLEGRGRGLRGVAFTFNTDKVTEVVVHKQAARLADLARGQRVRVSYETQNGALRARLITVVGGAPAQPMAPVATDANTIAGVVRRVALTDREIVIIAGGPQGAEIETTISVLPGAKITRDQKTIRLEDVNEGEQASVQVERSDRKVVAKVIQVGRVTVQQPRSDRENRIDKIRQILKMVDFALQRLGENARNSESPSP
jgi:hypothetical protein